MIGVLRFPSNGNCHQLDPTGLRSYLNCAYIMIEVEHHVETTKASQMSSANKCFVRLHIWIMVHNKVCTQPSFTFWIWWNLVIISTCSQYFVQSTLTKHPLRLRLGLCSTLYISQLIPPELRGCTLTPFKDGGGAQKTDLNKWF